MPPRDDVEYWDDKYQAEFDNGIKIGKHCPSGIKTRVIVVIKRYWDNLYKAGACRPIRGFEFVIDTGDATPVCCFSPVYGPHESNIINQQLEVLRSDFWSRRCGGPWGSMILLAPKPHQENIDDIKDLIWRMCVSFWCLNLCNKPFIFPIPRCADAIEDLGELERLLLWCISLDCRQGFYQILIR
jgi:hypothetical protein